MKRRASAPLLALAILLAGCNNGGSSSTPASSSGIVHFVPNSHAFWSNPTNWTTALGPAYADITLTSTNFVPCRGGPFALCYYSGPSSGPEDLSCTTTADGKYANCQCFDIPYGVYFVDINAILNHDVYEETVAQCGADGSGCATLNSAPVCANVNQGNLIPGSSVYSTFSFDCVPENGLGLTDCANRAIRRMHDGAVLQDQPGRHRELLVSGIQRSLPGRPERTGMHARRRPGLVGSLCAAQRDANSNCRIPPRLHIR